MADIGLSAFSVFFMGSPSFLAHQRALEEGQGRSNCQTLFGMTAVPSDAYIRLMLDGASPAAFDPLFFKAIETEGVLTPFQRLGGRTLIALDGTEHFCSRKIHCKRCSTRRRSDGGTEYFHSFLGASIVAPGHTRVLPLPPEFVAPQDGAEKQDCERNAAKRWLARHGPAVAQLRPVYLGDDLFACQPIAEAIHRVSGSFILTCKPASHQTVSEYLHGATLEERRRTEKVRGRRTTTIYRWLSEVRCAPPIARPIQVLDLSHRSTGTRRPDALPIRRSSRPPRPLLGSAVTDSGTSVRPRAATQPPPNGSAPPPPSGRTRP